MRLRRARRCGLSDGGMRTSQKKKLIDRVARKHGAGELAVDFRAGEKRNPPLKPTTEGELVYLIRATKGSPLATTLEELQALIGQPRRKYVDAWRVRDLLANVRVERELRNENLATGAVDSDA